jgi:hypothetical protein
MQEQCVGVDVSKQHLDWVLGGEGEERSIKARAGECFPIAWCPKTRLVLNEVLENGLSLRQEGRGSTDDGRANRLCR